MLPHLPTTKVHPLYPSVSRLEGYQAAVVLRLDVRPSVRPFRPFNAL